MGRRNRKGQKGGHQRHSGKRRQRAESYSDKRRKSEILWDNNVAVSEFEMCIHVRVGP